MQFQQPDVFVDRLVQTEPFDHLINQADPTGGNRLRSLRDFIMDVGCRENGAVFAQLPLIQSFLNATLACGQLSSYLDVHSKTLRVLGAWFFNYP